MTSRRAAIARMGSIVLALGARDIAWGASIIAVRVWITPRDDGDARDARFEALSATGRELLP